MEGAMNNEGLWLFAILALLGFGGAGFGNRSVQGDYGQYATAASQQEILFGQHFQNLDNKMDRLGNGIADATFALNNSITGEGRATQTQIANCCCENLRNTDALRFDLANYNAGIISAIGADGEKTRSMIQQNKIESLQQKINDLTTQINMAGVVRYPMQSSWFVGGNPFCGGGCGCNAI